jgi:polyisoprenoid-binding protein YceI
MSTTTTAIPQTSTTTWNIDPAHSAAEFKVKHMMIANRKGQFSKVSGVLVRDESNPANDRVEATIEAPSIHTRDEQRDAHPKKPRLLSCGKVPDVALQVNGHKGSWAKENCRWKAI